MSDTPDSGGRRRFEPPPWEREQFEELARKREAEDAERKSATQDWARQATAPQSEEPPAEEAGPAAESEAAPEDEAATGDREAAKPPAKQAPLDDKVAAAMLLQLQAEDPHALGPVRKMGERVAYVTAAGAVLLTGVTIANVVVAGRGGEDAQVYAWGGAIFGTLAVFTGCVAAWLYIRAKR